MLDRLTGELCDALTGARDGQRMLERLERASLFIRPLDEHRRWYSFHPLFRDLLRYELRATSPGEERGLCCPRAAAWHLERGETDAAAEYLLPGRGLARGSSALVKAEGGRYFEQGEATERPPVDGGGAHRGPRGRPRRGAGRRGPPHHVWDLARAGEALLDRFESVAEFDEGRCRRSRPRARAAWISYHASPEQAEAAAERALGLLDGGFELPGRPPAGHLHAGRDPRALATCCLRWPGSRAARFDQARDLLRRSRDHRRPAGLARARACGGGLDRRVHRAAPCGGRWPPDVELLAVADDLGLVQHPAVAVAHLALARAGWSRATVRPRSHLAIGCGPGPAQQPPQRPLPRVRRAGPRRPHHRSGHRRAGRHRPGPGRRPTGVPAGRGGAAGRDGGPAAPPRREAGGRPGRIDAHDGLVTADVLGARAAIAAAAGDTVTLRKVVDDWPALEGDEPVSRLPRGLWTAVLHERDGDRRAALAVLGPVVVEAESEGWVRLFLDAGGDVARLLRALYHAAPTAVPPAPVRGCGPGRPRHRAHAGRAAVRAGAGRARLPAEPAVQRRDRGARSTCRSTPSRPT